MSSADTTTSPVDTTTPVDETSEGFWDKYGLYVIVVGSVLVFVVVVYYFFLRNDTRDGTIADVMRCDEYRKLREALS
jgi:RsiW-degrading membrane proteinase PrsW (M82 family)